MLTRRRFLQGTLAASGLVAGSATFANTFAATPPFTWEHLTIEGAVFEPRYGPSATFAARVGQMGLKTLRVTDDITPVWAGLVAKWRRAPVAITGLTSHMPLLLLEQSGRDHGLRVVFRGEHKPDSDGSFIHTLDGPELMLEAFRKAAEQPINFGSCMATIIGLCLQDTGQPAKVSLRTHATEGNRMEAPLYSWVIAPPAHRKPDSNSVTGPRNETSKRRHHGGL